MILLIIPKINVAYFSKFSSQSQNGVYMILSILSSMFKHLWRRQYMYFYQVDIFEILLFNQNIIFLFCCIFQEFSRLLKAIDWETRNTIQNRLYYLELWSSTKVWLLDASVAVNYWYTGGTVEHRSMDPMVSPSSMRTEINCAAYSIPGTLKIITWWKFCCYILHTITWTSHVSIVS